MTGKSAIDVLEDRVRKLEIESANLRSHIVRLETLITESFDPPVTLRKPAPGSTDVVGAAAGLGQKTAEAQQVAKEARTSAQGLARIVLESTDPKPDKAP